MFAMTRVGSYIMDQLPRMTRRLKDPAARAERTKLGRLGRPLLLVLLTGFSFLGGAFASHYARATTEGESPYAFLRQLAQVLVLVENEYIDPIDRARLLNGSIQGMVAELDPHSSYMPPRDYSVFLSDTEGEFGGVGIEVDFRNDAVTVIAPIEGSPAHRAGVLPGDRVIAINKVGVRDKSAADLVRLMRGKPGTEVLIAIRRKGHDTTLLFTLKREIIQVSSVASAMLEGGVAYLRIKQFQTGTHSELLAAVGSLREQSKGNLRGAILDLRNNPGGLVREATAAAGEFLDGGTIYTTRRRGETIDDVHAPRGGSLTGVPMVALVNEYSASAAELVAGALQDRGRATLVGARTFGKGSVQSILDLPGGAGLRLTTMRYYTPKGRSIQAQGVVPDVLVEAAYVADKSFGVLRESDLDNHLPAEATPTKPAVVDPKGVRRAAQQVEEETGISPTHLGVARIIPTDPTGGPDFALSIGYQIVRGVLNKP